MASVSVPTTTGTVVMRDILRKRQQRSRARRATNVEQLRTTRDVLERAHVVLRTIDDDDAVWDDFLDDDLLRARRALQQFISLANEERSLTSERVKLQRLLHEHQLASSTIATMMAVHTIPNDWEWHVSRWCELTRQKYRPWTMDECKEEMAAALKEVLAFQWSTDKQSSGMSFMGWREERRVDPLRGFAQFQVHKTLRGYEMMDYVNGAWDTHEVLQVLRPNVMIIRRVERYSSINQDAHAVCLVFRVRTERGFTQFVRSIRCPALVEAFGGPGDKWPVHFLWMNWERLASETGDKVHMGGSMDEIDPEYAHEWIFWALSIVTRGERMVTGRKLITSE